MKTLTALAFLLLADVLCAQTPNLVITPTLNVSPSYQGIVATYPITTGNLDIEGVVLEVSNGTSIAALGLSLTVDGPGGTQAYLTIGEIRPYPTGLNSAEWTVLNLTPTPFSVSPTSGVLSDDTTHYFHMQAATYGGSGFIIHDFALVIVVGNPSGQGVQQSYPAAPASVAMTITPTINSQAISGTVAVTVGTPLSALGIYAENGAWASIGVHTSISNIGTTGINPAEFCAYDHHDVNVPAGTPSGTFNTVGTHQFSVVAWGLIIGLINQGGYLHWTHEMMALRVEFTVNVVPDPTIEISDSQGTIAPGSTASGDRDFGVHDLLQLPTAWAMLQIANNGTGDLNLSWNFATPAQGAGAAAFGFDVGAFTATVTQGSICQLAFRLEGGVTGVNAVWVEIWHNDLNTANPFLFQLKGEVTAAPQVAVSDSAGVIAPGAAAGGPRDFGTIDVVNMPTAAVTVTIANTGSADLHLGTPVLNGVNIPDFLLILSAFGNTVPSGASTSFDIRFDATSIGVKSVTVSFTHDDTLVTSPFTFDVSGIAVSANQPLITTTTLPAGMEGAAYMQPIVAAGGVGALGFSVVGGALPPGVQLSMAGELSGTPTAIGDYAFTAQVEDSVGSTNTQALTLAVTIDPLAPPESGNGGGSGGGCVMQGESGGRVILLLALIALAAGLSVRAGVPRR